LKLSNIIVDKPFASRKTSPSIFWGSNQDILKSVDQHAAIITLPTSIRKTLKKNGIITKRWQDNEITERAQEYLTIARANIVQGLL